MGENSPKLNIVGFEISAPSEKVDFTAGLDFHHLSVRSRPLMTVKFSAEVEGHPNGLFQSEPICLSYSARDKIQALLEQLIAEESQR